MAQTCGYIDGNAEQPYTCTGSQTCTYNTVKSVFGCADDKTVEAYQHCEQLGSGFYSSYDAGTDALTCSRYCMTFGLALSENSTTQTLTNYQCNPTTWAQSALVLATASGSWSPTVTAPTPGSSVTNIFSTPTTTPSSGSGDGKLNPTAIAVLSACSSVVTIMAFFIGIWWKIRRNKMRRTSLKGGSDATMTM